MASIWFVDEISKKEAKKKKWNVLLGLTVFLDNKVKQSWI